MLLLHCCCAPCCAPILEKLLEDGVCPTLFFFNPNIFPVEEYEIRKNELKRHAGTLSVPFVDGDYDHAAWLDGVKGLENQPERGSRCLECFKMRLLATAKQAKAEGFDEIATTLASSRWKNLTQITEAGDWAVSQVNTPDSEQWITFWSKNWRKDGLTERRKVLLEQYRFYNQTYCGCEFSRKP
jgi:predicted adenine nucleotide alpha hydrolase (AANH) superfamily ATPase